ncbi:transcriptional regulator with XRE-family HTH domain [Streptomyces sp. SAI-208]|uniref:helix-turn-helix domain-containing protein n=1 Tax=unclassified Streptomyces TaxID=2593676 RepID=UPI002473E899|nr:MULTISPECIES: helix-turn-helix transcriptional regulator [unclassified Streptomyces]MDH6515687.1 transcriptional regulator with XRE-family HTH domain [Streptomyces sp. SAI-090]MDH6547900.1 transcriptional regulator with XRE-family HTH domain [Streptomyces sp. SAI-041]MDH6566988.1 transcriptional regulator with XRE-family HTH domain [Streptomyces sp. SAI-117]MDH6588074.1 transcriptional regulator with XRE-family HTH domain [Streptomyces sp. SAI-133]MDH6606521.1 transcriptional regulator with
MTRWRPLPDSLPREARHLVEQLRHLKDRTDLSLAELARRTAYSKSSWQRYLSGAKQPPRGAVQALCRVAGADQARLLALWDLADPVWPYGPKVSEVAVPQVAVPVPAPVEYRRWRTAALVAFAVIVLLVAGVLWAWPSGSG